VTKYWQSIGRAFALLGLALAGVFDLAVAFVSFCLLCSGLFFFFGPAVLYARRRAVTARELAGRWCGIDIPAPYRPEPPEPEREPDGWYRRENSLYKTPRWPKFFLQLDWISDDPATARDLGWLILNPLVSVLLPVLTGLTGSLALRWYGRWTSWRLREVPRRPSSTRSGLRRWLHEHFEAFWHQLALFGLGLAQLVMLAPQFVVFLGPWPLFPTMTQSSRAVADTFRRVSTEWIGVRIDRPYLLPPPFPVRRADGMYQFGQQLSEDPWWPARMSRFKSMIQDRATWRDVVSAVLNPLVSAVLSLPVLLLVGYGFIALQTLWLWRPISQIWGTGDTDTITMFSLLGLPEITTNGQALLATPIALALIFIPVVFSPWLVKLQARFGRLFLGSTEASRLAQRVSRLERTRTDTTDAQAEELRRIERDLHDGIQSRLVAMGMKLGAVEALIDTDPTAAKKLTADLRQASSTALTELRELVRGIQPPVLSERGLVDAVRAAAMDSPLKAEVSVDFDGRVERPVESCVYFAVCELLTNAVKHGEARAVTIELRHDGGALRVTVTDNGIGGANPARGTGLRGIERRLGAFDGKLTLVSPPGGTTTATLEIPCRLDSVPSSPKTNTSSATD
jgi:signal transduction histidine kinase